MRTGRTGCFAAAAAAAALLSCGAAGQMQFEIPPEMLSQMMGGGMMGGGQQQRRGPKWPKGVSGETEDRYDWIANTEWQGKTSRLLFAAGGGLEAAQGMNECKREGSCLWAANGGQVRILTKYKMLSFTLAGSAAFGEDNTTEAARKAQGLLEAHFEEELRKVVLVSVEKSKTGQHNKLTFKGVKENEQEGSLIAKDLYAVLGVPEDADEKAIKSAYRKLSVKLHPDKREDRDSTLFNEVRDANEVLSNKEKRGWYDAGGILLVKNMETGQREIESQEALALAQLDQQVPKNHPMRKQAEAQIKSQIPSKAEAKRKLTDQMTNEDETAEVQLTLAEVYTGVERKDHVFNRLTMCRGCRHDPTTEECMKCGRCPPERRQVPKPGPFPGTIMGMKEVEIESKERCQPSPVPVKGLRVPRGVKPGAILRKVPRLGHQTPGRLPGAVSFVASIQDDPRFFLSGDDLYTVLELTAAEALFGCVKEWRVAPSAPPARLDLRPGQAWSGSVHVLKGLGMPSSAAAKRFGNMYVRVEVIAPKVEKGAAEITFRREEIAPHTAASLRAEDAVQVEEDGQIWRRWNRDEEIGRPPRTRTTAAEAAAASSRRDEL
eukprot:TRINITY_DN2607_c0_g2_i1.p1 TRINITY_DN2607_c0_g2~~TRINITY_DN2607_c0_g2_i1.p1  ORF type:complete len:633 (+),score=234.17 TRINITY_DN2607_c0_g2_i1:88-1899(+)